MADDQDVAPGEDEGPWPRLEPVLSAKLGVDIWTDPRVPRGQVWAMPAGGWPPADVTYRRGDRVMFETDDGRRWVGTIVEVTDTGDGSYELQCRAVDDPDLGV